MIDAKMGDNETKPLDATIAIFTKTRGFNDIYIQLNADKFPYTIGKTIWFYFNGINIDGTLESVRELYIGCYSVIVADPQFVYRGDE